MLTKHRREYGRVIRDEEGISCLLVRYSKIRLYETKASISSPFSRVLLSFVRHNTRTRNLSKGLQGVRKTMMGIGGLVMCKRHRLHWLLHVQ